MARVTVPPWMAQKLAAARDQIRSEQSNPNRKWVLLLLLAWSAAGILAIAVPRGKFNANRSSYYSMYGRYVEYENQQRQYENQQNNNNNNYYNNGNYGYPECSWWQWQCRKKQYYYRMQNGGNRDDQIYTPAWYRFFGGREGEEDERFYEEMGVAQPDDPSATGAVKFVHAWTQLLFVLLLIYGVGVIYLARPINGLVMCMNFFAQFSLLNTVLICQGVIRTDGRELENSVYGWQGQLPILMAYQSFSSFLFCLGFCLFFFVKYMIKRIVAKQNAAAAGANAASKEGTTGTREESNYTTPGIYKNLQEESRTDVNTQSNGYSSMA